MNQLNYNNIFQFMKVILANSHGLAAQVGATGTVDLDKSDEALFWINWDEDKFRYQSFDNYISKTLPQMNGGYRYVYFLDLNTIEGRNLWEGTRNVKSENLSLQENNLDIYCNCSSPNFVESFIGLTHIGKKFFYCRNCKKERHPF